MPSGIVAVPGRTSEARYHTTSDGLSNSMPLSDVVEALGSHCIDAIILLDVDLEATVLQ